MNMRKIFRLSDIKYLLLLFLSMAVFLISFCIEHYYDVTSLIETVMYCVGLALALVWGILNYVSHLKIGAAYKKYDSINIFVETMKINRDEKVELSQYLNDFAKDLEEKGESRDNAIKKAISHFQVQEFLDVSGGELFEKQTHWYMIGYILIFLGIALVAGILHYAVTFYVLALAAFILILYSIGFLVLFFLYRIIDGIIK